jgi:hypothetical protein
MNFDLQGIIEGADELAICCVALVGCGNNHTVSRMLSQEAQIGPYLRNRPKYETQAELALHQYWHLKTP